MGSQAIVTFSASGGEVAQAGRKSPARTFGMRLSAACLQTAIGNRPLKELIQVKSNLPVYMLHLEPATGRGKKTTTQWGTVACPKSSVAFLALGLPSLYFSQGRFFGTYGIRCWGTEVGPFPHCELPASVWS